MADKTATKKRISQPTTRRTTKQACFPIISTGTPVSPQQYNELIDTLQHGAFVSYNTLGSKNKNAESAISLFVFLEKCDQFILHLEEDCGRKGQKWLQIE